MMKAIGDVSKAKYSPLGFREAKNVIRVRAIDRKHLN